MKRQPLSNLPSQRSQSNGTDGNSGTSSPGLATTGTTTPLPSRLPTRIRTSTTPANTRFVSGQGRTKRANSEVRPLPQLYSSTKSPGLSHASSPRSMGVQHDDSNINLRSSAAPLPSITVSNNNNNNNNNPEGRNTDPSEELRKMGMFRGYLQGLDKVRHILRELQNEMQAQLKDFYQEAKTNLATKDDEQDPLRIQERYLRRISDAFDSCNRCLQDAQQSRVLIKGQAHIPHLINRVRELQQPSNTSAKSFPVPSETLQEITDFWSNLKYCLEVLQTIGDKFQTRVVAKLRETCLSYMVYSPGDLSSQAELAMSSGRGKTHRSSLDVGRQYSQEVQLFLSDLEAQDLRVKLLAKASANEVGPHLINSSSLSHQLVEGCNVREYPLLLVVPEVALILQNMFRTANSWLDREETYVYEINQEIHKTRMHAKERQQEIAQKQVQHQELMRSVKTAYLACQNTKQRLNDLTDKLAHLENELKSVDSQKSKAEYDKLRKEGMLDFLDISIAQTRRNHILHLKRQKIMRQVKELESNLQYLQQHLQEVSSEVSDKLNLKVSLESQYSENTSSYKSVRKDLDLLSKEMRNIQGELLEMRVELNHLESVQTVKTSMETLETLHENSEPPPNMQLSPSLQAKLSRNRRLKGSRDDSPSSATSSGSSKGASSNKEIERYSLKRDQHSPLIYTMSTGLWAIKQMAGQDQNPAEQRNREFWISDAASVACYHCDKKFTTFRRKHHCRMCGQVFCHQCSSQRINGRLLGINGMQRVCEDCATKLMQMNTAQHTLHVPSHHTNDSASLPQSQNAAAIRRIPVQVPVPDGTNISHWPPASRVADGEVVPEGDDLSSLFGQSYTALNKRNRIGHESIAVHYRSSAMSAPGDEDNTRSSGTPSSQLTLKIPSSGTYQPPQSSQPKDLTGVRRRRVSIMDSNFWRTSSHPDLSSPVLTSDGNCESPSNSSLQNFSPVEHQPSLGALSHTQGRSGPQTLAWASGSTLRRLSFFYGLDGTEETLQKHTATLGRRASRWLLDKPGLLDAAAKSSFLKEIWLEMTGQPSASHSSQPMSPQGNTSITLEPSSPPSSTDSTTSSGEPGNSGSDQTISNSGGAPITTHRYKLRQYPNCVLGHQLVDWLLKRRKVVSREQGVLICQTYVGLGLLHSVSHSEEVVEFRDDTTIYSIKELSPEDIAKYFNKTNSCKDKKVVDEPLWLQNIVTQKQDDKSLMDVMSEVPDMESIFEVPKPHTENLDSARTYFEFIGPVKQRPVAQSQIAEKSPLRVTVFNEEEQQYFQHLLVTRTRRLIAEMVMERYLHPDWIDCILGLAAMATQQVRLNAHSDQDCTDLRYYVHIKKVQTGRAPQGELHPGVVFTGSMSMREMHSQLMNPRVLLLSCALEYSRRDEGMISFEQHLSQLEEWVQHAVNKILACKPNLLIVQEGVAHQAKEMLAKAGVAVINYVKPENMRRLSRLLKIPILPSIEHLVSGSQWKLGTSEFFRLHHVRLLNGLDKCLVHMESTTKDMQCSILLHGQLPHELVLAKEVLEFGIFVCHNLRQEVAFLRCAGLCWELGLVDQVEEDVEYPLDNRGVLLPSGVRSGTESRIGVHGMIRTRGLSISPAIKIGSPFLDTREAEKFALPQLFSQMTNFRASYKISHAITLKRRVWEERRGVPERAEVAHRVDEAAIMKASLRISAAGGRNGCSLDSSPGYVLTSQCLPSKSSHHILKPPTLAEKRMLYFRATGMHPPIVTDTKCPSSGRVEKEPPSHARTSLFSFFMKNVPRLPIPDSSVSERGKRLATLRDPKAHPFDVQNHQHIPFLYSVRRPSALSSSSRGVPSLDGPQLMRLKFYDYKSDTTLGIFLEMRCFRQGVPPLSENSMDPTPPSSSCWNEIFNSKFVHGSGCVRLTVKPLIVEKPWRSVPGNSTEAAPILVWSWCRICHIASPLREMDTGTWHLSFAKLLDLLHNVPLKSCQQPLRVSASINDVMWPSAICPHSTREGLQLCFTKKGILATFDYHAIQLHEFRMPPCPITWEKCHQLPEDLLAEASETVKRYYHIFSEVSHFNLQLTNEFSNTEIVEETFGSPELEAERRRIAEKVNLLSLLTTEPCASGVQTSPDQPSVTQKADGEDRQPVFKTMEEKIAALILLNAEVRRKLFEYVNEFEDKVKQFAKRNSSKKRSTFSNFRLPYSSKMSSMASTFTSMRPTISQTQANPQSVPGSEIGGAPPKPLLVSQKSQTSLLEEPPSSPSVGTGNNSGPVSRTLTPSPVLLVEASEDANSASSRHDSLSITRGLVLAPLLPLEDPALSSGNESTMQFSSSSCSPPISLRPATKSSEGEVSPFPVQSSTPSSGPSQETLASPNPNLPGASKHPSPQHRHTVADATGISSNSWAGASVPSTPLMFSGEEEDEEEVDTVDEAPSLLNSVPSMPLSAGIPMSTSLGNALFSMGQSEKSDSGLRGAGSSALRKLFPRLGLLQSDKRLFEGVFTDQEHFPKEETVGCSILVVDDQISTVVAFFLCTKYYHTQLTLLRKLRSKMLQKGVEAYPSSSSNLQAPDTGTNGGVGSGLVVSASDDELLAYSTLGLSSHSRPANKRSANSIFQTIQNFVTKGSGNGTAAFSKKSIGSGEASSSSSRPSLQYKTLLRHTDDIGFSSDSGLTRHVVPEDSESPQPEQEDPEGDIESEEPETDTGEDVLCATSATTMSASSTEMFLSANASNSNQPVTTQRPPSNKDKATVSANQLSVDGLPEVNPEPHIALCFEDSHTKFYCQAYYGLEFEELRRVLLACEYEERGYILSLARCCSWLAQGGKSKASFFKTKDQRFIIKEVQETELDTFVKFLAPFYFKYMTEVVQKKCVSTLAKVVGVYRVGYDNRRTGMAVKMNIVVMENIFYGCGPLTRIFDLKGSLRNRLVNQQPQQCNLSQTLSMPSLVEETAGDEAEEDMKLSSGKASRPDTPETGILAEEALQCPRVPSRIPTGATTTGSVSSNSTGQQQPVFQDENFIRESTERPYYVRSHSKMALLAALQADTEFLSRLGIMDYSLVVGVETARGELVLGLVDYLRRFTFDKWLESFVKGKMGAQGVLPTIVDADLYRERFMSQMEKYFLNVPDHWLDHLPLQGVNAVNLNSDWFNAL